jgi:hypothetical protein
VVYDSYAVLVGFRGFGYAGEVVVLCLIGGIGC